MSQSEASGHRPHPDNQRHMQRAYRTVHLPRVLSEDYGISRSEARRIIAQGGVEVNGEVYRELDFEYPAHRPVTVGIRKGRERSA